MNQGFVYFSFGAAFLEETARSIQSLLRHNPEARVTLLTDETPLPGFFPAVESVIVVGHLRLQLDESRNYAQHIRLEIEKLRAAWSSSER